MDCASVDSAQCFVHPPRRAEGVCARCGAFQCQDCVAVAVAGPCRACARPVPRAHSAEADWAFRLALIPVASWLAPVLYRPWVYLLVPIGAVPVAAIAFVLALIARRQVRRGLVLPQEKGLIPLALVLNGAHLLVGTLAGLALGLMLLGLYLTVFMGR